MRLPLRALAAVTVASAALVVPAVAAHADAGHEGITITFNNNNPLGGLCVSIHVGEATTGATLINQMVCLPV